MKIRDVIHLTTPASLGVFTEAFSARESKVIRSFSLNQRHQDHHKERGSWEQPFHKILHIHTFPISTC